MPKFNERFRALRQERGLSQMQLSKILKISKSSVNMYERGEREPGIETLELIADTFNVDLDYLIGKSDCPNKSGTMLADAGLPSNIIPMPKMRKIPLIGTIACGAPILAAENIEKEVDIPDDIHADFALRCKGDSMINARIFDGDIVYIRQQDIVDSGEIAAVLIDDEATLKRVKIYEDHISLEPENPMYKPLVFWGEEMNNVRILGKAVAFTGPVK